MAWASTIAKLEYACPRCKQPKGMPCRSPSGRKSEYPHNERVRLLTDEQWSDCTCLKADATVASE